MKSECVFLKIFQNYIILFIKRKNEKKNKEKYYDSILFLVYFLNSSAKENQRAIFNKNLLKLIILMYQKESNFHYLLLIFE